MPVVFGSTITLLTFVVFFLYIFSGLDVTFKGYWLDFNTINEFIFKIIFINPAHCCILTKPN